MDRPAPAPEARAPTAGSRREPVLADGPADHGRGEGDGSSDRLDIGDAPTDTPPRPFRNRRTEVVFQGVRAHRAGRSTLADRRARAKRRATAAREGVVSRPMRATLHPPRPPGARRLPAGAWLVVVGGLLAGCAGPRLRGGDDRDGPEPNPPPGLLQVPDAEPKIEPIRAGGPNKPYTVWGQSYVPLTADAPFSERGLASWYGRKFSGKPTASGELYNLYAMTAAHPTLPIPSYARIRNPANGREVVVRINDRGPFHSQRIVDLSYTAALKLDILRGTTPVELERITADDIRTGAWRHEPLLAQTPPPADPPTPPGAVPVPVPVPVPAGDTSAVSTAPVGEPAARVDPGVPTPPPTTTTTLPPIDDGARARAGTPGGRGFWVQLGAFRQHDGAVDFQKQVEARVDGIGPLLTVFGDAALYRLQAGPYASRDDARDAAERLRTALRLVPVIVERR